MISTKKWCPRTVNIACHVKQSSKTTSFGGTLSWRWRGWKSSVLVVPTATTRILRRRFRGTCDMVGQVFKFLWRLRWKINAVCMSLSPFVSFQSRFSNSLIDLPSYFMKIHFNIILPSGLTPIWIFLIWLSEYSSLSYSLCNFLHFPVTSSLLGSNSLLSSLFSNTLSRRHSFSVFDPVSHPYKTTGKIIIMCTLIFIFLNSKMEEKNSAPYNSKHSLTSVLHEWNFDLLGFFSPNIWIVPNFKRFMMCLYVEILSSILITSNDHVYWNFSAFVSRKISLLATTTASVFFFIQSINPSAQYNNIISIKYKLICTF